MTPTDVTFSDVAPTHALDLPGLLAAAPPAGGAALDEILIATAGALILTVLLLTLGIGHRSGRVRVLARTAAAVERRSGLPGWVALPAAIATASLLTALFGMYWDISLHIDQGRDEGPLANAAHYYILIGLFGIFSAGFMAMVLPKGRPSATAVRLTPDWHAPLGGVLIVSCAAFALLGFPLDDAWHRIFGQDVTLWGPTHLMLIGGAAMTLLGIGALHAEGARSRGAHARGHAFGGDARGWLRRFQLVALSGGLLIGMSTFQAEFDFGIPQFRLVFHPMLVMLAAGLALVAVRVWLGRGAALGAVAFFIAMRGLLALLVGPVLGEAAPHFPLYVVEAAIVELVALRIPRERPLRLGLACGVLIGTVGLVAEWGWSHAWMTLPWPAALLPEGALLGLASALAGALLGAWIGARLGTDTLSAATGRTRTSTRPRALRAGAVMSAIALAGMIGYALYKPADAGVSARVVLEDVPGRTAGGAAERAVAAVVQIDPPAAAEGASWLTATAWQGGGLVVDRLERTGPGSYRTSKPIPVSGTWKALLRLHRGNSLMGLPLYLPEDDAIPAAAVPARASFTRAFVADHELLQREQKGAPAALSLIGYALVLVITLGLLGMIAWGLHRLAAASPRRGGTESAARTARRPRRPRPQAPAPLSRV